MVQSNEKQVKLSQNIIAMIRAHGFITHKIEGQNGQFYMELNQGTPLGEDWWVSIWFDGTDADFIKQVWNYYYSFSIDDEVAIYVDNRGHYDIPESISDLIMDANWKELALKSLAEDLSVIQI